MKALTVKQPYATAIVRGFKTVENRSQRWAYRGPLAIHAGKAWSNHGAESVASISGRCFIYAPQSAIIGLVDLVDVHEDAGCCLPWGMPGRFHLVLDNPRSLDVPVPCGGRLGLWNLPLEIAELLAPIDAQAVTE